MVPVSEERASLVGTPAAGLIGKWEVVLLLWVAFFLNQADRQIFNVTLPLIRDDLRLTDTAMGLVATTFTVVYGLCVPFSGIIGDIFDRRRVVISSLLIFSLGTLLTGAASSFVLLLVFRGLATGAGEALYTPAAVSLIGDSHVETRARALAVHQTANYTGVVLGSLFAAWVAQSFGWRVAFITFGVAGTLWAFVILWRARRIGADPAAALPELTRPSRAEQRQLVGDAMRLIAKAPLIWAQIVAFGGLVFALVGFLTWMPTLLVERFGLALVDAGFAAVFYHHLFAYFGVLSAGVLTDRLVKRWPRVRLITMALGLIMCAPGIWLASEATDMWQIGIGLAAFGLFRGVYDASIFAALFDIVEDRLRSTVTGIVIACAFLIGAASPLVMAVLKADYGLDGGLRLIATTTVLAGLVLLFSAFRHGRSEGQRAGAPHN